MWKIKGVVLLPIRFHYNWNIINSRKSWKLNYSFWVLNLYIQRNKINAVYVIFLHEYLMWFGTMSFNRKRSIYLFQNSNVDCSFCFRFAGFHLALLFMFVQQSLKSRDFFGYLRRNFSCQNISGAFFKAFSERGRLREW